ncbi:MAG: hypothetical protein KJ905_03585 [Nanoarchaeota archaeon]|nr:hypothetical protein [Nanoarchaeota archaeon]MBU1501822.1 hypothetical protein [Nanoarchaeota archaeon]
MGETLEKIPFRTDWPPEDIIEWEGYPTNKYGGIMLHSVRVNGTHYTIECAEYDATSGKWMYEFLNSRGEWESYKVSEEAIRERISDAPVRLEIVLKQRIKT